GHQRGVVGRVDGILDDVLVGEHGGTTDRRVVLGGHTGDGGDGEQGAEGEGAQVRRDVHWEFPSVDIGPSALGEGTTEATEGRSEEFQPKWQWVRKTSDGGRGADGNDRTLGDTGWRTALLLEGDGQYGAGLEPSLRLRPELDLGALVHGDDAHRHRRLVAADVPELVIPIGDGLAGERGQPHLAGGGIVEGDELDAAAFLGLQGGHQLRGEDVGIERLRLHHGEADGGNGDGDAAGGEAPPQRQAVPPAPAA